MNYVAFKNKRLELGGFQHMCLIMGGNFWFSNKGR